jgi:hypothetical protein
MTNYGDQHCHPNPVTVIAKSAGLGLPMPSGPLVGTMGSYTYQNAGGGAILWSEFTNTGSYSFSGRVQMVFLCHRRRLGPSFCVEML